MRTSRVVFAGIAVAAAAATTSAFTASNTVPASIAGYGQAQITGVTVSDIGYKSLDADATKLKEVDFTVDNDVSAATYNATMTLKSGGTAADTTVVGTPYTCSIGSYSGGHLTITCLTADNPAYTSFTTVGLTVNQ
jgi:hypothetical protein